ncbi:MAG: hypothetical protein LUG18_12260 [Candidatus Azobacteroides sp.]|nr:hypothetical protein [Candidatus Azobacteroides sp.]
MASKRMLKKSVNEITEELFMESLYYVLNAPEEYAEQLETIISRLTITQEDFLKRINNPDGKDNPTLVKKYYSKLKDDFQNIANEIIEQLNTIREKMSANVNPAN